MINANDQLTEYTGTENYCKYLNGLLITDGVKALAEKFQCFWFLDIIASYQPQLANEEFQVWSLARYQNRSAEVKCMDGNDRVLQSQNIPFTDFLPGKAIVWLENNVILLPSEH